MLTLSRLIAAMVVLTPTMFLFGCSSDKSDAGKITVKGKLLDKGSAFIFDSSKVPLPKGAQSAPPGMTATSGLQIMFISDAREQIQATYNADDGTFFVNLKPGRYKVAITGKAGFSPDMPDYFKNAYSTDRTQISRDVKEGEEIVIDVSKPGG